MSSLTEENAHFPTPEPEISFDIENLRINDQESVADLIGEVGDEEVTHPAPTKKIIHSASKQRHLTLLDQLQKQASHEKPAKADCAGPDEPLSLKAIVEKQQSQRIISSPRDYQMELFERAKNQNTIAVLDTGSGKTLIAVLLIRHTIDRELEDRAAGSNHRVAVFLTDKVALAVQQQAVLKANLDQNIGIVFGSMNPDLWSKEAWDEFRLNHMAMVCTPDILLHAVLRASFRIEDLNLLIFDEAHHAKKDHPYAKIMREVSSRLHDPTKRPKIFGMTASPVDGDAGEDLVERAFELESILHATIATTNDQEAFRRDFAKRPHEQISRFTTGSQPMESDLFIRLWTNYGHKDGLKQLFQRSRDIACELGVWCSDLFWAFALSEKEVARKEARLQRGRRELADETRTELTDAEISDLRGARKIVEEWELPDPKLSTCDLSMKVMILFEHLLDEFEKPTESKCLVFVERKDTARLLHRLAEHLGGSNLLPGMLTGTNFEHGHLIQYSAREQALTMMRFRNQELNCIFATSVAEEGIDVPDCNLVIRFDPCHTMIKYIQSRGRARHQNSTFVHFIERGNIRQESLLQRAWAGERGLKKLCADLPPDRKIDATFDQSNDADCRPSPRVFIDPTTGAKLTYDFSLIVLQNFVSSLPHEDDEELCPTYITSNRSGTFTCEVILPSQSPVEHAIGRPYSRKQIAKRSAAFEACLQLRKLKYLDASLSPIYTKKLPALRNAKLALSTKSSNQYPVQSKPTIWASARGAIPSELFLTIVMLKEPWDRPVRPMGMLTRTRLPALPTFPIFRINGEKSDVSLVMIYKSLPVTAKIVEQLTWFSLTIFKDLFNKKFEHNPSEMSYWMAPLIHDVMHASLNSSDPSSFVDWTYIGTMHMKEPYEWSKEMKSEELIGRFLIDPWDGGRRLFTRRLAPELSPDDAVPEMCAPGRRHTSIIDYSVSLFKQSRLRRTWDPTQPVIEAEKTMHRLNVLAFPNLQDQETLTKCFVCPEPLKISHLSSDIAAMSMLMPAVIHRMESYLIALEFTESLKLNISPSLALEAITKDSDNSEEVHADKINFQHGMGPNYERLELLGDTFLKMATSIAVYTIYSNHDEYSMHCDRMSMLCNINLFHSAKANEWYKYIRAQSFSRRTWYPHGIRLLEGKGYKSQEQQAPMSQRLADKTIADVCEAVIGAALLCNYINGMSETSQFDDAVRAVSRFVASSDHTMEKWNDYYSAYSIPKYQSAQPTASQRDLAQKLATKYGYQFKSPRLARCAFMHASQPRMTEQLPSYQRLEFLGDALLDMAIVFYLFQSYPEADPQWLTEHKMAMVSNRFLSALCVKLGLYRHLRHSHSALEAQVRHFVGEAEEAERESGGARDYWVTLRDPPKCLSDIVESYIGAVFVDSEYNYAEVQKFFDEHIKWYFEDQSIYDTFASDNAVTKVVSILSEQMGCFDHHVLAKEDLLEDGVTYGVIAGVFVHEKTIGSARAKSTRNAKSQAAQEALELLQDMSPSIFRQTYNCTCRSSGGEKNLGGDEK